MKKSTITLWNVPLNIAEIAVGALRSEIATMAIENYPADELNDLCFELGRWEEEIADEKRKLAEVEKDASDS